MEIKDNKGKVIDRVLSITKEGEKALEELGYENIKKDKKEDTLLEEFINIERKKTRRGSGDDLFYEKQVEDYINKQRPFWITFIKFIKKNKTIKKLKIDRTFVDIILGKTESRQEAEIEVLFLLGYKNYKNVTKEDFELIRKITMYALGRDMKIIELTAKHIKKEYKI